MKNITVLRIVIILAALVSAYLMTAAMISETKPAWLQWEGYVQALSVEGAFFLFLYILPTAQHKIFPLIGAIIFGIISCGVQVLAAGYYGTAFQVPAGFPEQVYWLQKYALPCAPILAAFLVSVYEMDKDFKANDPTPDDGKVTPSDVWQLLLNKTAEKIDNGQKQLPSGDEALKSFASGADKLPKQKAPPK